MADLRMQVLQNKAARIILDLPPYHSRYRCTEATGMEIIRSSDITTSCYLHVQMCK